MIDRSKQVSTDPFDLEALRSQPLDEVYVERVTSASVAVSESHRISRVTANV